MSIYSPTTFLLLITWILFTPANAQDQFLTQQKKHGRVKASLKEKENVISQDLKIHNINLNELNIMIIAFKEEGEFHLYAKKEKDSSYTNIITYEICASSGVLGPKRKRGDYQIPEGFYHINRFNPESTFYLSLGLNYPNASDRIQSKFSNLGGDIFIHGMCATIGCLPMTNDKIKEIYLYAIHARNNGQSKIPVYIFPFKMTDQNLNIHNDNASNDVILFWKNLKIGYDQFMKTKKDLNISIHTDGTYLFKNQ